MGDVSPYLYDHAMRVATHLGGGTQASITFRHHGAVVRAASSDDRAARCDQVEALTGEGPCVEAMERHERVLVTHLDAEPRWVDWRKQAATEGFTSALAVPARIGPGMDVALNLYAPEPDPWDERALSDTGTYARRIADALSLRMQFSTTQPPEAYADLTGPQVLERAVDAVRQCNGCSTDEALEILLSASLHRNVGLEHVAATILLALTGVAVGVPPATTNEVTRDGPG